MVMLPDVFYLLYVVAYCPERRRADRFASFPLPNEPDYQTYWRTVGNLERAVGLLLASLSARASFNWTKSICRDFLQSNRQNTGDWRQS